jgi:PhnB protein
MSRENWYKGISRGPTKETAMQVQPYLFFDGRCEEAIEFYHDMLGAEVTMLMRNNESPEPPKGGSLPPGSGEKVMHAQFRIGDTMILASDGRCSGKPVFQGFALSLTVPNDAEAQKKFAALSEGGKVQMLLGKTFFSSSFGMVVDRFGVLWMVYVVP